MPNYVYACSCGNTQDVYHSITSDPKIICECGEVMQRKPQGAYVTFSGSGFYSTDSKKS